jgi:outer membrane protein insertion porin family
MGLKQGDSFNEEILNNRINYQPDGGNLSSLFMNQGYLFVTVQVNKKTNEKRVDLTFEIFEGEKMKINKVFVTGNSKVSSDEILELIDIKAGDLFSRGKIVSAQNSITASGLVSDVQTVSCAILNPSDGTVDITFKVEEL